jgi:hypothetical protein
MRCVVKHAIISSYPANRRLFAATTVVLQQMDAASYVDVDCLVVQYSAVSAMPGD